MLGMPSQSLLVTLTFWTFACWLLLLVVPAQDWTKRTDPGWRRWGMILALVFGCWGATFVKERDGVGLKRDEARFYIGLAVFTLWLTLGPKAGLYTLLYYTVPVFSFLRAPARIGIVVTLALVVVGSHVLAPWLRSRFGPITMTRSRRRSRR